MGKKKKKRKAQARADSADVRRDFMDYDSRGITPMRFGDTRPQYYSSGSQNYAMLASLYHSSGIARKIVNKPAKDAVRNGWRLVIPDDPEMQADYQQAMDKLKLKKALSEEIIYQRLYGDGYITIGTRELSPSPDPYQPIDTDHLLSVQFVHAFGQTHVQRYQTDDNPYSETYGQEQAVVYSPTSSGYKIGPNGEIIPTGENASTVVIDKSRYFHASLDKLEDDETGTSILQACFDQIKAADTALYSTGKMLFEYTLKSFKSDQMANEEDEDKFDSDYRKLADGMSTESLVLMASDEDLTKISTNVSGIQALYDYIWQQMAAVSDIPRSVFIGEQAGTLAGASQDVINYYDGIKSIQEDILKPQIEYIMKLLFMSSQVCGGPVDPGSINWSIEFNPLWSADDKTQSETLLNTVNAASTAVSAGIIDPDEGKAMLAGQSNNAVQSLKVTVGDSVDQDMLTRGQLKSYRRWLKKEMRRLDDG